MKKIFLGWNRPLCETVPEYLLAGTNNGMLDLRGTTVVIPTRQSGWRLRACLPLTAERLGCAVIGPEIITPPVLLAVSPTASGATGFQCLSAWLAVLKNTSPDEFTAFLGPHRDHRAFSTAWALQVASRLQELRTELSDGGLSIRDVADREDIEETDRWTEMAELEQRYRDQLKAWNLEDPLNLKLGLKFSDTLAGETERVVVAGVADPPKLFMTILDRWVEKGGTVEVLIAGPEEESPAFDRWGRPIPEVWLERNIELDDRNLWLEATPDDQAVRIREAITAGMDTESGDSSMQPQLAIGAPDRETLAPLQRELESINLPAFDPQDLKFSETPLFRLVQSLLALRASPGYAETAGLLRHPDVFSKFKKNPLLLAELDKYQSKHLPVTLNDLLEAENGEFPLLKEALARVAEWRDALKVSDIADGLRAVLGEIYGERTLNSGSPHDSAFQQSVTAFDTVLRELEGNFPGRQTGDAQAEILMERLRNTHIKAERGEERVDLEGWLELAWNPAPLLFVAGMNEGFVPDGHMGDMFLPDTLRKKLELRDDSLRTARDAYMLTTLVEQRRKDGNVILLSGKTSASGDPLRPSRLLFRCPDNRLVSRARMLFGEPRTARRAGRKTGKGSFKLDPGLVPDKEISRDCLKGLSPTVFRDYLQSPLRFYLLHVLKMKPVDDRAREPDASAFGNLIHDVLRDMGRNGIWACGDAEKLGNWLEERLNMEAGRRYGERPWLGVELAKQSAVQRLKAFAGKQAEWHGNGWDIIRVEETIKFKTGRMNISGRVDRIDRNRKTGAVCVLDYKTGDRGHAPEKVHLRPVLKNDFLENAVVAKEISGEKGNKRWGDLQLPLYREFVRFDGELESAPDVRPGYICLPDTIGETGFLVWENYCERLHELAMRCAEEIAGRIEKGIFRPAGVPETGYRDDFAGLFLDDPEKNMCEPENPWERGK